MTRAWLSTEMETKHGETFFFSSWQSNCVSNLIKKKLGFNFVYLLTFSCSKNSFFLYFTKVPFSYNLEVKIRKLVLMQIDSEAISV